jgi:blue copper oxidase
MKNNMNSARWGLLLVLGFWSSAQAQNLIPIPDTLSGADIYLSIADSNQQFYPGINTPTIGYNGRYLGPTILLNKGQNVAMHVTNMLADTTTTHWHGLHVAPINDGSPHNPIIAGDTWLPSFAVMDNAATYWYHPHLHGKTMDQVLKGAAGLIIVRDSIESSLNLPRTYGVDDIPVVCQFQTIDGNTKQIVLDDELDNATMVNGTINAMVNVPAQVVRLRLLNASSHRVLTIRL